MVKYYKTPYSVNPNIEDYDVIIDIVSITSPMSTESILSTCRDEINNSKRKVGDITVVKKQNKLWIALHCIYDDNGGSNILFKEDGIWKSDRTSDREKYFKECLNKLKEYVNSETKIFSNILFSKIHKPTAKKHLTDIVYFIENIDCQIPKDLDWTIHYQLPKRYKNNKLNKTKNKDHVL